MTKWMAVAFAAALVLGACPALAQGTYGPPAPVEVAAIPPDMPRTFDLREDETVAQAAARFHKVRRSARRWEAAYQILNAGDAIQTIVNCNGVPRTQKCEANPLFGAHPSTGKVIGIKAGFAIINYLVFQHELANDPYAARDFAKFAVMIQGSVVAINMRVFF